MDMRKMEISFVFVERPEVIAMRAVIAARRLSSIEKPLSIRIHQREPDETWRTIVY